MAARAPKSEQSYRRHRDLPPETDVDVGARSSVPQLIVPREVEIALFFVAVVEGQGIGIERAPDDFRLVGSGRQHGEVYIIKEAGLDRLGYDVGEDGSDPASRPRPIVFHPRFAIMRDGNAGPTVQDRLAHGGYGARVMHVRAEI